MPLSGLAYEVDLHVAASRKQTSSGGHEAVDESLRASARDRDYLAMQAERFSAGINPVLDGEKIWAAVAASEQGRDSIRESALRSGRPRTVSPQKAKNP